MARKKRLDEIKAIVAAEEAGDNPEPLPSETLPIDEPEPEEDLSFVLFERDPYLRDKNKRYEFKTIVYADGPQIYAEFDTQEKKLTFHFCVDEKEAIYIVGDTQLEPLEKVIKGKITLLNFMLKCCNNHRFASMDGQQERPLEPKDFKSKTLWPEKGQYL